MEQKETFKHNETKSKTITDQSKNESAYFFDILDDFLLSNSFRCEFNDFWPFDQHFLTIFDDWWSIFSRRFFDKLFNDRIRFVRLRWKLRRNEIFAVDDGHRSKMKLCHWPRLFSVIWFSSLVSHWLNVEPMKAFICPRIYCLFQISFPRWIVEENFHFLFCFKTSFDDFLIKFFPMNGQNSWKPELIVPGR